MGSNEANELKITAETLRQMMDMLLVLGRGRLCNQCVVSADSLNPLWKKNVSAAAKLSRNVSFFGASSTFF